MVNMDIVEKESVCPACDCRESTNILMVEDWEFNSGKKYNYCRCGKCGSLFREIKSINNIEIYDSNSYSTLTRKISEQKLRSNFLGKFREMLIKHRNDYVFFNKSHIVGRILSMFYPVMHSYLHEYCDLFAKGARILDVGSGTGKLAYELKMGGVDVHAIEPYLKENIYYKNGLVVEKKFIDEVTDKYDIVFMNNVFEHLENPRYILTNIYNILNDYGVCGIVIPGYGNMTKQYQENSYIIQAPQHVCLYTPEGIKELAKDIGFSVIRIERKAKIEWYIKSYMLEKGIQFDESMGKRELFAHLNSKEKKLIKRQYRSIINRMNGDWYHIILKKKSKKSSI